MSGNPFRRSQFGQPAAAATSSTPATQSSSAALWNASTFFDSPDDSDTEPNQPSKATKSKRVRIETPPPLSPGLPVEELKNLDVVERSHGASSLSTSSSSSSPPPPPSLDKVPAPAISESFPTKFVDPVELGADRSELVQDEEVVRNTRRNSETGSTVSDEPSSGKIANPFRRTLATLEGTEAPATGDSKPSMDVDSFKRMLLTGEAGGLDRKEPFVSTMTLSSQQRHGENNGAISTHRSAYQEGQEESLSSASEESKSSDEMDLTTRPEALPKKKTKPPPPAPRSSKIFSVKGPQVVSFDDFAPTESSSSTAVKSGSKALPKLPSSDMHASYSANQQPLVRDPLNGERATSRISLNSPFDRPDTEPTNTQSANPRIRPPPPLARRSSEKKGADLTRRRANSGASETSDSSALENESQPSQSAKINKAPPPPPARRGGSSKSNSVSQTPTLAAAEQRNPPAGKLSTAPPPPPPPARRRGSSKSSTDLNVAASSPTTGAAAAARTSGEFVRSISQDSGQALQQQYQPTSYNIPDTLKKTPDGAQKNVLADLTAFQAEVDALRDQYRRPEKG